MSSYVSLQSGCIFERLLLEEGADFFGIALKRTQRGPHFALEVLVAEDRGPTDRVGLDVFPYQLVGVLIR